MSGRMLNYKHCSMDMSIAELEGEMCLNHWQPQCLMGVDEEQTNENATVNQQTNNMSRTCCQAVFEKSHITEQM